MNLRLEPGSATGIIGPNGAGKTTLLRVIAGELFASGGKVAWGDRPLEGSPRRRAEAGVRKTFQHVRVFNDLTVREHIWVTRGAHGRGAHYPPLERFLERAGLVPLLDQPVTAIPSGTVRLVDMAMAIAAEPTLVLLDEPFAGLSATGIDAVSDAVIGWRERGATVLVVEHRLRELFALVDRVVVMHQGGVIADGPTAGILELPIVRGAYGVATAEASTAS